MINYLIELNIHFLALKIRRQQKDPLTLDEEWKQRQIGSHDKVALAYGLISILNRTRFLKKKTWELPKWPTLKTAKGKLSKFIVFCIFALLFFTILN